MASVSELPSGKFRTQIRRKNLAAIDKLFDTRDEAVAWGIAREAELVSAQSSGIARPNAGMTFKVAVQRYFDGPKFSEKAPGTRARERSSSTRLLEYFGDYALSVIDGAMVQDYIDMRCNEKVKHRNGKNLDKKMSPDSVRLEKAFLSSVFKFSKRRNLVTANIMRDTFELPTCIPREGRITLQQQMNVYDAAREMGNTKNGNPCLLPWVFFVFETGSRPGEAAKIELSWVNLPARKISIPRIGQKKRKPRDVLIGDDLAAMLAECVERAEEADSKYLFFSRANVPLPTDGKGAPVRRRRTEAETAARPRVPFAYYNAWRYLCKKAGIPSGVNPHIVRHEFISRLFEDTDLNDSQIASLVGDLNVLSLEPYKHLRVERLRDRQDAHLDEMRVALRALQEAKSKKQEAFFARARDSREEAQEAREAAGDFSTPMERIRAAVTAEAVIERVAAKKK
ncbi:MAG: tyrosine-type recombinase/integrase [Pseudomonadota bacterium]|nr:tyrosine-type recombinase/integrase [Pseudomonadota bacterium]